jgi:4-hydroxy-2,2'-bipyrrole-5-carbaldehyde O-methyltransferase
LHLRAAARTFVMFLAVGISLLGPSLHLCACDGSSDGATGPAASDEACSDGSCRGPDHAITDDHHHAITDDHHHAITDDHHHAITDDHHHAITDDHHHAITEVHVRPACGGGHARSAEAPSLDPSVGASCSCPTLELPSSASESVVLVRPFYKLTFLASATACGLLRDLAAGPVPFCELQRRHAVREQDGDAFRQWLDIGRRLGLIALGPDGYRLRGIVPRLLAREAYEPLSGLLEEVVAMHHRLITEVPAKLRKGEPYRLGGDHDATVTARASRMMEPLIFNVLDRAIPAVGPVSLLDVGCGTGTYLRYARSRNPELGGVGLELSEDVAALARGNLRRWGVGESFEVAAIDVRAYRPPRGFDVVMLHNNIYYFAIDARVPLLRSLRGLLNRGGRLIVTTACEGASIPAQMEGLWATMTEGCGRYPTVHELSGQLAAAGFRDVIHRKLVWGESFYAFEGVRRPRSGRGEPRSSNQADQMTHGRSSVDDEGLVVELQALAFRHRSALILPFVAPIVVASIATEGWPSGTDLASGPPLLLAGVWCRLWALRAIGKRARVQRAGARELLVHGPYAHMRNPIYLANTSIAVGLAALAGSGVLSVAIGIGCLLVYTLVVRHEERALAEAFGARYDAYVRGVGRWLPRLRGAEGPEAEPSSAYLSRPWRSSSRAWGSSP